MRLEFFSTPSARKEPAVITFGLDANLEYSGYFGFMKCHTINGIVLARTKNIVSRSRQTQSACGKDQSLTDVAIKQLPSSRQ